MDTYNDEEHVEIEEIHVYQVIEGNSSMRSKSIFGPKSLYEFRKRIITNRNSPSASAVIVSFR